jgi:hypothetical protein
VLHQRVSSSWSGTKTVNITRDKVTPADLTSALGYLREWKMHPFYSFRQRVSHYF